MGKLLVIAGSSGPFSDFAPYVPSINDRGVVAFQALRRNGRTGAFCGNGGPISCVHQEAVYRSHADINNRGLLCAFADLPDGRQAVLLGRPGEIPECISHEALQTVGPLGPTMNESGAIAFRANLVTGSAGIVVADESSLTPVAETGGRFRGFEGLPLIIDTGTVFFRARHVDGGDGIHAWSPGRNPVCIVETGVRFVELGHFPSANSSGAVVFAATQRDGTSGIFRVTDDRVECVIDSSAGFESFRGALIDDAGRIVFFATPRDGTPGIYALDTPGEPSRLIGLGAEMLSTTLADFALNPVSINNTGQIALRLKLADGRQFITRMEAFE